MITDRVGDFIIRLQNAARVGKRDVRLPYSSHLFAIAKKLKELGFVASVETKEETGSSERNILITLNYDDRGTPKLRGVKRVSKPGRRMYLHARTAHGVRGGTGARIISTPLGILSNAEARKRHVGGEDLFEIW